MAEALHKRVLFTIGLVTILIFLLFPFYWLIITSFKPDALSLTYPPKFLPSDLYLENYNIALFGGKFHLPVIPNIVNSFIVGFSNMALVLVISIFAAFALSKYNFRARNNFAFFILSQRILPPISIIIPYYVIMSSLGLLDTLLGLILTYLLINLPFSVWMLITYFNDIPKEIEEAAWVDGCSKFSAFLRITLPLSIPGIIVVAIFSVINSYNEFLFALILTGSRAVTLPPALSTFITIKGILWGQMAASTILGILPVIVFAMLVQKHLVRVMTLGALKG
ncbi:MAG: carbohydrate ABC transporter permease [Nitrososphaerales archaeon]